MHRNALALGLLVLLLSNESTVAQHFTSGIEGRVADGSGAGLGGVLIALSGENIDRTVTTVDTGDFRLASLPAGTYSLTFELAGFQATRVPNVRVPVNRMVRLDVTLDIAGIEEHLEVTADPARSHDSAALTFDVDPATVAHIPLNGRAYLDLLRLFPGVVVNTHARSDLTERDTRGAVLGERAGNVAFRVDGFDNRDPFYGGAFQALNLESIQELELIETGYKAEFGGGSAALVNVVTRSGGVEMAGDAYLFLRDDALDSSTEAGEPAPTLKRRDYGFTLGGPFAGDRAGFFASAERIVEEREALFPSDIPESLADNEDFSRVPKEAELRALAKVRYRADERSDLAGHLSFRRWEEDDVLASPLSLPSASNDTRQSTWLAGISWLRSVGSEAYLETSFSARRQDYRRNEGLSEGLSASVFLLDDGTSFDFGPRFDRTQTVEYGSVAVRSTLTARPGKDHTVKFGGGVDWRSATGSNGQGLTGVIVTTRDGFEAYGPNSFQIVQGTGFLEPGDESFRVRNTGVEAFFQDDWRIAPHLVLNLGIRYDIDMELGDTDNLAPRLGAVWTPAAGSVVRASWGVFYDRYRLGLAQPVPELGGFDGRTVVELNYPRLAADVLLPLPGSLAPAFGLGDAFTIHDTFGIPRDAVITVGNVASLSGLEPDEFLLELHRFLDKLGLDVLPLRFSPFTGFLSQDLGAAFADSVSLARPFRTPHNQTLSLGFEQDIPGGVRTGVTYVHRRIKDMVGIRLSNLAFESRALGGPITTDGAPLRRAYGPWYDGTTDAVILTASRDYRNGFLLNANYTFTKSTDNLLNSNLGIGLGAQGGGAVPTDNLDLEVDRGNSDLSVPHRLVVSGVAALPAGFRASAVFTAMSGLYFSAVGLPTDYDGDGIVSTRPPETSRNEFRGPSSQNLDLRVEKDFRWDPLEIGLFVDVFNATNARNPRLIDADYVEGEPGPRFGEIRVPLPGREVQIGVRARF